MCKQLRSPFCRLHVNLLRLVFADIRKKQRRVAEGICSRSALAGADATNMHARSDSESKHAKHDNQVATSDLISGLGIARHVSRLSSDQAQCFRSICCVETHKE